MDRFSQGQRTLLFIDEAQHLTLDQLEEVRLLTNLEGRDERALQVLLIGQSGLMKTLQTPELEPLRQRIAAVGRINVLDDEQTIEYVRTQITEVGGSADSIFTAGALSEICDVTGGIPRRINQICHRALVLAYAHESGMVDAQYIRAAAEQILLPMPKQEKSVFHSHHLQATYEPDRRPERVIEESTVVTEGPNVIEVGAGIDDEERVRILASDYDEEATIVEPDPLPVTRPIRERESRFQRMYSR
jgi:hypothetical protein